MRRLSLLAAIATAALLAPSAARAQQQLTVATVPPVATRDAQDTTLAGVKKVFVAFDDRRDALGNAAHSAERDAIEDLKRAGLKVVAGTTEPNEGDMVLRVAFTSTGTSFTSDVGLRIDLERVTAGQGIDASRTVLWSYQRTDRNVVVDGAAPAMLRFGMSEFVSRWMGMNAP